MSTQKEASYFTTNSYSTLNYYTEKTKNVWIVFHGMGYLSKYFINYFAELNADENYIIAPQAPSKYYQDKNFKRVGASWLTRENTAAETKNILNYIDAVYKNEIGESTSNLIVLGYSQGVSIAARWIATRKIRCNTLILHSGAIPVELQAADFTFLKSETKVFYIYGNKDQYVTEAKKTEQYLKSKDLFKDNLIIEVFDGVHEVSKEFILKISKD